MTRLLPGGGPPVRPQASTVDSKKYVDGIGDEDAMVNAKLHSICRAC